MLANLPVFGAENVGGSSTGLNNEQVIDKGSYSIYDRKADAWKDLDETMNGNKILWGAIAGLWLIVLAFSGVIYHGLDNRLEKIEIILLDVTKRLNEATVRRNMQIEQIQQRLELIERKK